MPKLKLQLHAWFIYLLYKFLGNQTLLSGLRGPWGEQDAVGWIRNYILGHTCF